MKISTKFIYFFNRLLNKFFKLNILDTNSSIDLLLDTNVSLARYGDGELNIMMGGDIHFQKYHPELAYRLKKLLKNNKNKQRNNDKIDSGLYQITVCNYSSTGFFGFS